MFGIEIQLSFVINAATITTLSADSTTGALTAGNTTVLNADDATSTTKDSTAIMGQVNLASHKNFTITPGAATNHFNAGTTTNKDYYIMLFVNPITQNRWI